MGAITISDAALIAVTGYLVDFAGIVLLMLVIIAVGKFFSAKKPVQEEAVAATPAVSEKAAPKAAPAPGSAGELKLYDTDPRDAALIMAIVADHLGKPLNELRFKSIKEVK